MVRRLARSKRLKQNNISNGRYLGEFVYGAIDGTITTFAIVAGATGAGLSFAVVVILGFANLIADGFSMAVGSYLSERTQQEYAKKERRRVLSEVESYPDLEKDEIKKIYKEKGFKGNLLTNVVSTITRNKRVWVNTILTDKHGITNNAKDPMKTAMMTFFGFLLIGLIPLLSYLFSYFIPFFSNNTFLIAIILTAIAMFIVGAIKSHFTQQSMVKSGFETVLIGGVAAILAFLVGHFLRWLVAI